MSCILKYFSFLCQLKGHKASNKNMKTDAWQLQKPWVRVHVRLILFFFNWEPSEKIKELFINFHTFDVRPRYLPKYVDMGDFPPNDFFLGISTSQVECKWKKSRFFEGQSLHILLKSHLSIDKDLVHHQIKSSC